MIIRRSGHTHQVEQESLCDKRHDANKAVEATAPRRCRLVRDMFHYVIVPGGAALPGAVPHLDRWAT
jgi:hypothetical protein